MRAFSPSPFPRGGGGPSSASLSRGGAHAFPLPRWRGGQGRGLPYAIAATFSNAQHPKQQGFTLVELIIALALSALLAALVFASFGYAERSSSAAYARGEAMENLRGSQRYLRDHMEGILPLRYRKELGQPLRFVGERERMVFVAPVVSRVAEGGVMWWELGLARGKQGGNDLVLRRAVLSPDETSPPNFPPENVNILATNVKNLHLSYFDQETETIQGQWTDQWSQDQRMPLLVRVDLDTPGRGDWTDFIVQPKVSLEVGCPPGMWAVRERRCNITGAVVRRP